MPTYCLAQQQPRTAQQMELASVLTVSSEGLVLHLESTVKVTILSFVTKITFKINQVKCLKNSGTRDPVNQQHAPIRMPILTQTATQP